MSEPSERGADPAHPVSADELEPGGVFTVEGYVEDPVAEPDDYVRIPAQSSPMKRGLLVGLVALAVLAAAAFAGYRWFREQLEGTGSTGEVVQVEIQPGATVSEVAELLDDAGVIGNRTIFGYWLTATDRDPVFQAGEYELPTGLGFEEALDALAAGPEPPESDTVTIPEGLRASAIYEFVAAQAEAVSVEALEAAADGGQVRSEFQPPEVDSLEGFLFPDTYQVDAEDTTAPAVLGRLVEHFDEVATEVGLGDAPDRVGYSPYEVLTVASLIEKETAVDAERARIARVIYNRLERQIPLGIDATIIYVVEPLREAQGIETPSDDPTFGLTESELAIDSPYNTRTNLGLPPTPIGSPGRASLEAALAPEPGDWTYYVLSDCAGNHTFSFSQAEHEAAVAASREAGILDGSGC